MLCLWVLLETHVYRTPLSTSSSPRGGICLVFHVPRECFWVSKRLLLSCLSAFPGLPARAQLPEIHAQLEVGGGDHLVGSAKGLARDWASCGQFQCLEAVGAAKALGLGRAGFLALSIRSLYINS